MPISCQSLSLENNKRILRFDSLTHHQADMVRLPKLKKYVNFNNNETYSFNWLEGQTKIFSQEKIEN